MLQYTYPVCYMLIIILVTDLVSEVVDDCNEVDYVVIITISVLDIVIIVVCLTQTLYILQWLFLTVPDQSLRGGYMLCFLDDGQGMSPGTSAFLLCLLIQKHTCHFLLLYIEAFRFLSSLPRSDKSNSKPLSEIEPL